MKSAACEMRPRSRIGYPYRVPINRQLTRRDNCTGCEPRPQFGEGRDAILAAVLCKRCDQMRTERDRGGGKTEPREPRTGGLHTRARRVVRARTRTEF